MNGFSKVSKTKSFLFPFITRIIAIILRTVTNETLSLIILIERRLRSQLCLRETCVALKLNSQM